MGLRKEDKDYSENRPPYMRNTATGRIFITTDALLKKEGMEPVYDYTPDKPKPTDEAPIQPVGELQTAEFDVSKATKQQIVSMAFDKYDAALDITDTVKVLREKFKELEGQANDAGGDADTEFGE